MVFIGPFEHHSNELPWRESIADVVIIPEDADGHIDLDALRAELRGARRPAPEDRLVLGRLQRHRHRHQHGRGRRAPARARGAVRSGTSPPRRRTSTSRCTPSGRATRSPTRTRCSSRRTSSSAGPATPGVLVARRELLTNRVPDVPGGGTVAYVNDSEHGYLADPEHREEGGTPAIIESIRAGLVFQLKQAVGVDVIRAHEERLPRRAVAAWREEPAHRDPRQPRRRAALDRVVRRARTVGPLPAPQLRRRPAQRPVRHPVARRLLVRRPVRPPPARHRPRALPRVRARDHRRLRGHQARAGCGSTSTTSSPRRSSDYIVDAVLLVARDGWRLLPDYRFDTATGLWHHRDGVVEPPLRLGDDHLRRARACTRPPRGWPATSRLLAQHLVDGEKLLLAAGEPDLAPPTHAERGLRAPPVVRPARLRGGHPSALPEPHLNAAPDLPPRR